MARKTTAKCLFALSTVAAVGIGMLLPSGSANAWSVASNAVSVSRDSTTVLTVYLKNKWTSKPKCVSDHTKYVKVTKQGKYEALKTATSNGDWFKWTCTIKGLDETAALDRGYATVTILKPKEAENETSKTIQVTVTPSVASEIAAKADEIAKEAGDAGISPLEMKAKLKEAGYTDTQWKVELNGKKAWLGVTTDWYEQVLKVGRRIYFKNTGEEGKVLSPKRIKTALGKKPYKFGSTYLKYYLANSDSTFDYGENRSIGTEIYGKTYKGKEYFTYAAILYIDKLWATKSDKTVRKNLIKEGFSEATADRAIKDRNAHIPTVDGIKTFLKEHLMTNYSYTEAQANTWIKNHIKK